jgi:hypothetical protein
MISAPSDSIDADQGREHRANFTKRLSALAVLGGVLAPPALAGDNVALAPGRYDLVAQTVLPNLEESLRYATTRSQRCLGNEPVDALFPILLHPAFAGCTLLRQDAQRDVFTLQCTNAEAASGSASLLIEAQRFDATLDLKMGGKNMTLAQRVSGTRRGACGNPP